MAKNKIKKTVTGIIGDPGVGFCAIDTILFWQTGGFGLAAMMIATAVSAGFKALSINNSKIIQKNNLFSKIAKNDKTPLRVCGLALITVAGSAMGGVLIGGIPALPVLWGTALLPALTSTSFAVANFCIANSISNAKQKEKNKHSSIDKKPIKQNKSLIKRIIKSPDSYVTLGLIGAGLMSGGASLLALPIVLSGYAVTINNNIKHKPEHKTHPKLFAATACAIYSGIGFATGNIYPAIANFLNVGILTKIESDITPGGIKRIIKDIKREPAQDKNETKEDVRSTRKNISALDGTGLNTKSKTNKPSKLSETLNNQAKKISTSDNDNKKIANAYTHSQQKKKTNSLKNKA